MIDSPVLNDELKEFCKSFLSDENNLTPGYWESEGNIGLKKFKKFVKDHYKLNQNYTCVYCRQKFVVDNNLVWDLEHIVPKKLRPDWTLVLRNLCIVCKDCNSAKGDKNTLINKRLKNYPNNKDAFLIFHPHFDDYEAHINIISEGGFYFPITEKGVRTYDCCGLSRFFLKLAGIDAEDHGYDFLMLKVITKINDTNDVNLRASLLSLLSGLFGKATKANSVKQVESFIGY